MVDEALCAWELAVAPRGYFVLWCVLPMPAIFVPTILMDDGTTVGARAVVVAS